MHKWSTEITNTNSKKKEKIEKTNTLVDDSGRRIPAVVWEGGTIFSTRMRLKVGIKRFAIAVSAQRTEIKESSSDNRKGWEDLSP